MKRRGCLLLYSPVIKGLERARAAAECGIQKSDHSTLHLNCADKHPGHRRRPCTVAILTHIINDPSHRVLRYIFSISNFPTGLVRCASAERRKQSRTKSYGIQGLIFNIEYRSNRTTLPPTWRSLDRRSPTVVLVICRVTIKKGPGTGTTTRLQPAYILYPESKRLYAPHRVRFRTHYQLKLQQLKRMIVKHQQRWFTTSGTRVRVPHRRAVLVGDGPARGRYSAAAGSLTLYGCSDCTEWI
jgi:hypothetical protein